MAHPIVKVRAVVKGLKEKKLKKDSPMAKTRNWIQGAIKKPGALHKELGIAKGKKIPAKTLAKATKAKGVEGKRARLAQTLKSFKKS